MDTIYYNLSAKRVKVSGGADLLTFVTTPAAPAPGEGGEVLDFARCRQRLETKNAWKDLVNAADPSPAHDDWENQEDSTLKTEEISGGALPQNGRSAPPIWLEIAASLAVISTALAATLAFLGLV